MGRAAKKPPVEVSSISSKKQLLTVTDVCRFLGNITAMSLHRLRNDKQKGFPQPLQAFASPRWTLDQIERWVAREEKYAESMSS